MNKLKEFIIIIFEDFKNNLDYIIPITLWSICGILVILICLSIISIEWIIYYLILLTLICVIKVLHFIFINIKKYIITTWRKTNHDSTF